MNQTNPTHEAIDRLSRYVRARYPLIALLSHEEQRVLRFIETVAGGLKTSGSPGRKLYTWSITHGLSAILPAGDNAFDGESTRDLIAALETLWHYAESDNPPAIFVFLDAHNLIGDPITVRYLREVASAFETTRHTLIFLSPSFVVPPDLEKVAVILDWPLPGADELEAILSQCERDLPKRIPVTLNGSREKVIQAMRGLTLFEASSVLLNAIAATGELGENIIPYVVREKAQIIRKSRRLEFYDTSVTMDQVGGLQYLKQYAAVKRSTFSAQAQEFGVEPAKGVLLVGVPGTGKSLSAKAIAGGKMPLLRMDIGALMEGLVGASESNMREALKVAEAVSPAVLWVDEIDKGLGGTNGGEHDGGTSMRVFGTLLTWMQETKAPVYVVATANDVRSLKPELLRRFDDIVFVDLPSLEDRKEIVSVHLRKRGRRPEDFDLDEIARAAWSFTGAEIEKTVKAALEQAFFDGAELSTTLLVEAAQRIVPIYATMKDQIRDLQMWSERRALQAGSRLEAEPRKTAEVRILDF